MRFIVKKFIIYISIFLTIVLGIFLCNDVLHKHNYVEEVITPDCNNEGSIYYSCECGDKYLYKTLEALEHSYELEIIEPTCESDGYTIYTCVCGNTFCGDVVPKYGHIFTDWELTTFPTMDSNGMESRFCECGYKEARTYICEHDETFEKTIIPATCKNNGTIHTICNLCLKILDEKETPTLSHNFSNWEISKKATPLENGEKIRFCECGFYEKEIIYFIMAGLNSIYIEGAEINVEYIVAPFTQEAVDTYDVICNYKRLNANNPVVLGHNTGSMKKLYNAQIGDYIYFSVNGEISTYRITVSEKAIEIDNFTNFKGLSTGYQLFDKANIQGNGIHLYTCYQDKELGKIRWIVSAEKIL